MAESKPGHLTDSSPPPRVLTGAGRVVACLLPGMGPLLRGRGKLGGVLLAFSSLLLGTAVGRGDRVVETLSAVVSLLSGEVSPSLRTAASGPRWQAVLALFAVSFFLWRWAFRDARSLGIPSGPESEGRRVWRQLRKNPQALVGLTLICALYLLMLLGPLLAPFSFEVQLDPVANKLLPPGSPFSFVPEGGLPIHTRFWLGSDEYARDVLSRLLYGSRVSLTIGFVSAGIAVTLGTLLGSLAAFTGRLGDMLVMRLADLLLSFPGLVLLLFLLAAFQNRSIYLTVTVIGFTSWMGVSRLVRAQILSLREQDFIQATYALGLPSWRILFIHLVPNALAPVIVNASLAVGNAILIDASLSFLGLGVPAPTATWGGMIAEGRGLLLAAWWLSTLPGLVIVMAVISFNLLGDGLRDALDPKLRS